MRFGRIEMNPARNPAVLDTAAWDPKSAWSVLSAVEDSHWNAVENSIRQGRLLPNCGGCVAYSGSCAQYQASVFFLTRLADGQHVFVELGSGANGAVLGEPIGARRLGQGTHIAVYATDADTVERYVSRVRPDKGPKALGATPRLGVGSRMSTTAWPGVWEAMDKCSFSANPIQNSVREVTVLEDILAGRPPRTNYLANFGTLQEGHTGSTFEGLWVAGVLEALKADSSTAFGADADHITLRHGTDDMDRAKRVIEAARRYTFFTLDVSDILDYGAMDNCSDSTAGEFLTHYIHHESQRREIVAYHSQKRHYGRREYRLDEAAVGRLVGKYWSALNAVEQLSNHIGDVKNGAPFDLELSIDETPSSIDAFGCLTQETELIFLALEFQRRRIPVTHIAPNFGIEKGFDYRGADGLAGLETRIRGLYEIACEFGLMLDCHSGDDLKSVTRRAVGRAMQGRNHFKLSPSLQVIFAETMNDVEPERFLFWWDDTLDYARREAAAGSDFAAQCIRRYESGDNPEPSPHHAVFHYYNFASVGKRDRNGQFIHREKFYDMSDEFYREYQSRICSFLCEAAADVFGHT